MARGDFFPAWISDRDTLTSHVLLWQPGASGGPSSEPTYLGHWALWDTLKQAGFSADEVGAIWGALPLGVASLTTFLLAKHVFPGRALTGAGASIFYTFNMERLWNTELSRIWLSAFIPFLLVLLLRFFRSLRDEKSASVVTSAFAFAIVGSLSVAFGAVNLPQLVVVVIGLAIFATFQAGRFLYATFSVRRLLTRGALYASLLLAMTAWWLPAAINYYFLVGGTSEIGAVVDPQQWSWTHSRNSFLNELWLNTLWAWHPGESRFAYWAFVDAYANPILQTLVFVPSFLGLSALLLARTLKERRLVMLLIGTLLGLMFVGKGLHEPLAAVNLFLYQHVPGLWLLREPWAKLSIFTTLILALLIGFSLDALCRLLQAGRLGKRFALPSVAGLLAIFPAIVFPIFLPDLYHGATAAVWYNSAYTRIPDYWWNAADGLRQDPKAGRVLVTPGNTFYAVPYTWGAYFADGLPSRLLPLPVLERQFGYLFFNQPYQEMTEGVYTSLENSEASVSPVNALALMNTRYILLRNDVGDRNVSPLGSPVPDPRLPTIHQRLQSLPGVALDQRIGELDLYRIEDRYFLPHFYVPAEVSTLNSAEALVEQTASPGPVGRVAFVAEEDSRDIERGASPASPTIDFEQVNPTKYRVRVLGANVPFLLVFSEGYHPGWKAYKVPATESGQSVVGSYFGGDALERASRMVFFDGQTPETWLRKSLSDDRHLRVNGYAQGWWLTQTGDYDLIIEYWPQRTFYWGLAVSGATLAGGVAFLLVSLRRRRKLAQAPEPALDAASGVEDNFEPFTWRGHPTVVLTGLVLLALAAVTLASGHEPQAEQLGNWAYFTFVAAVGWALLERSPILRLLSWSGTQARPLPGVVVVIAMRIAAPLGLQAFAVTKWLANLRHVGALALGAAALLTALALQAFTLAQWLANVAAVGLVLRALRRSWPSESTREEP